MLLTLDIGNTSVSVGIFEEGLKHHGRFETAKAQNLKEMEGLLQNALGSFGIDPKTVKNIAVSNVVPSLTQNLFEMTRNLFDQRPLWVSPETAKMPLRVETPKEVGADRLCNAVAAWEKWHRPTIVVDFGTATTLDIITAKGEYGGGAILPGIEISAQALAKACAQLQKTEVAKPKRVVGRNTIECIQAGLYYGTVGMIDHLVRLSMEEEKAKMKVVATGGLAGLIAKESKTIESIEPHLTLEGIWHIWKRNESSVVSRESSAISF